MDDFNFELDLLNNNNRVESNFKNSLRGFYSEYLIKLFLRNNLNESSNFNINKKYLDCSFVQGHELFIQLNQDISFKSMFVNLLKEFRIKDDEIDFFISQKFLTKFDFIEFNKKLKKIVLLEVKSKVEGLNSREYKFNKPSLDLYKKFEKDNRFFIKIILVFWQRDLKICVESRDITNLDKKITITNSEYCKKIKGTQEMRNGVRRK